MSNEFQSFIFNTYSTHHTSTSALATTNVLTSTKPTPLLLQLQLLKYATSLETSTPSQIVLTTLQINIK